MHDIEMNIKGAILLEEYRQNAHLPSKGFALYASVILRVHYAWTDLPHSSTASSLFCWHQIILRGW